MGRPAHEPALRGSIAVAAICPSLRQHRPEAFVVHWCCAMCWTLDGLYLGAMLAIGSLWWLGVFSYCAALLYRLGQQFPKLTAGHCCFGGNSGKML